jgi:hypothetical protein
MTLPASSILGCRLPRSEHIRRLLARCGSHAPIDRESAWELVLTTFPPTPWAKHQTEVGVLAGESTSVACSRSWAWRARVRSGAIGSLLGPSPTTRRIHHWSPDPDTGPSDYYMVCVRRLIAEYPSGIVPGSRRIQSYLIPGSASSAACALTLLPCRKAVHQMKRTSCAVKRTFG